MKSFSQINDSKSRLSYDNDNIYYNITIKNTTNAIIRANFNEQRVEPIVEDSKDYEMAVSRFSFDISNVPIFIWPSDTTFSLTYRYLGVDYTTNLLFVANRTVNIYGTNAIWSVEDFIQSLNLALLTGYLVAGIPTGVTWFKPKFKFNPNASGGTLTLTIPAEFTAGVNNVEIFFNRALYPYLQSFAMDLDNNDPIKYGQIVFTVNENEVSVGPTNIAGFVYTSEYNIIPSWSGVYSYVFSTTMPVLSENNSGSSNIRQTIITDFLPDESLNNKVLQYSPSVLRFYSLDSGAPLDNINLTLQWRDINDNLYPIYIDPNRFITVKLLFRKKIANQFEDLNDQVSGNR